MKFRVFALIIIIALLSFCGCKSEDNIAAIEQGFSKYEKDDRVGIECHNTVYFNDYSVRFNQLIGKDETILTIGAMDECFYYLSSKEIGLFSFEITINKCDCEGHNSRELLRKNGYQTQPSALGDNKGVYIEHYDNNIMGRRIVDYYDFITGEYISDISCDEQQTLRELLSAKNAKDNSFRIDNNKNSISVIRMTDKAMHIINDETLRKSEYYSLLVEYDYELEKAEIYDETIMFSCRLNAGNDWSLDPLQCCVVFEYCFEKEQILFKTLIFATDLEAYSIVCIEPKRGEY